MSQRIQQQKIQERISEAKPDQTVIKSRMTPKVSICVPNLNTRPYLPERFETIFNQTLQDWELLVYDSYSDDGAWEYIQKLAAREPRMRIWQGPRMGTPGSWNPCIQEARGEFVYIATSDDTMMPNCLEKMVAALEVHPECGLCQCCLKVINEKGLPVPNHLQWVYYTSLGAYDKELIARTNVRNAPHDGLLHPALLTIYTSITQLLIRRSVFDRVGLFEGRWGSAGDFEWDMRAALVENCVYIPDTLATWRIHPSQATQTTRTPELRQKMIEMARHAFTRAKACEGSRLDHINIDEFIYFLERDWIGLNCEFAEGFLAKLRFLMQQAATRPRPVADHILQRSCERLLGPPSGPSKRHRRVRKLFQKYGIPQPRFE